MLRPREKETPSWRTPFFSNDPERRSLGTTISLILVLSFLIAQLRGKKGEGRPSAESVAVDLRQRR